MASLVATAGCRTPSRKCHQCPTGGDLDEAISGLFEKVARQRKAAVVPFFLRGVADGPDPLKLFQADRIHPRAEAHPKLLENVWPELKKLLK